MQSKMSKGDDSWLSFYLLQGKSIDKSPGQKKNCYDCLKIELVACVVLENLLSESIRVQMTESFTEQKACYFA